MSRRRPAHARPATSDEPAATGPRPGTGSPLAQALRDLTPPRHGRSFWNDLDGRLADEPQLRLAPRSAIRPITQPPPVVDDRNLAEGLKGDGPPPRRTPVRTVVAGVAAVLVALLVVAAVQDPDDETTTGTTDTTDAADSTPSTSEADTPPPETAPDTTAPGTVDPDAPLTPGGVGPLTIGSKLGELALAGVPLQVDDATFTGSGGTCYDARVAGSLDLVLRFRPPEGEYRVDDPNEGVLISIAIQSGLPTQRQTDTGLALGAPQDQVLATYGANLDEWSHPFVAGGRIFRAEAGDGTGIAFFTDGLLVNRIAVGVTDAVRFVNQCR